MIISLFVIPNPLIDTYVNRHMGGSDGSSSRQFNMFHSRGKAFVSIMMLYWLLVRIDWQAVEATQHVYIVPWIICEPNRL